MGPHHQIGRWRALALSGFVLIALALAGYGVVAVSSRQWRVQATFEVRSQFSNVAGIGPGDRVRLQGIDAGVVEAVEAPVAPGQPVCLVLRVDERLRNLVRSDAVATIVSEGVVGARVVELVPGKPDAAPLAAGQRIASQPPLEMSEVLKRASASLARLDAVASSAETGLSEINAVAASVRRGEGSLGKLVRDDEAYDRLVALSERGQHAIDDLEENLEALKQTWPISRYFTSRAYFDRDRVLFQPGAARLARTMHEGELFEPGRAILTPNGRRRLDEVGAWFKRVKQPTSEVVIAAFTDAAGDAGLAQVLTQEQAEAVRKYLINKHGVGSSGWFSSRKVAAVGFGTEVPRGLTTAADQQPPRRVEVIVFTPQA
ncbi:MAG: OmpA family protein [Isosphaeraceae bacterium]